MTTAEQLIRHLQLQPHPREGGFFRETYRSELLLAAKSLEGRYTSVRSGSTAIYYLLTPTACSALHRLATDELFHFYLGSPVRMLQLAPDGSGREVILGPDLLAGQQVQVVVPRGVWQGAILEPGGDFALLGCTVAPGFEYEDYEHGQREPLTAQHPCFAELVHRLTPEG